MTDDIIIDGVTMPTPALGGLTIKKEKVWSNNIADVLYILGWCFE